MIPAHRPPVDVSKLNPQEQLLFKKYGGKLPTHKSVLMKTQKDRKYFDSGDYAMSKAGVTPQTTVGTAIPSPENIPHASSPANGQGNNNTMSVSPTTSSSPPIMKESSLSQTSDPEESAADEDANTTTAEGIAEDKGEDDVAEVKEGTKPILIAPQPTSAVAADPSA